MASAENRVENRLELFRPQLLALDDEALAIAASKGLVRRAQKDLQKGAVPQLQHSTESLVWNVDGFTVTLPATGFLEAHCTCPATNVCRHLLAAYLWGRSQLQTPSPEVQSTSPASAAPPSPQLPAYALADLVKWAGKPTVREALAFLNREPYEIEVAEAIIGRFPQANVTCRYFPATGLTGMLCSCKARQICLHQVATVLAGLRSQGIVLAFPESPSTPNSSQANQASQASKAAATGVIAHTQTLLKRTVAIGLLHLSSTSHEQFVTLSVSAQGAKLPRLALALRSIAAEIDLSLKRDAAADTERLFEQMAHTFALGTALQQTAPSYPVHLAGQAKRHYENIGRLELIGMGAYSWQTQSGYSGLTVLFWDAVAQQWCSWSEARPRFHGGGFDPIQVYYQPGPWEGITHPSEASQSCLCLYNARRNYQGRLSSSRQTAGIPLRPTQSNDWMSVSCCFQDWDTLKQHILSTQPVGLTEASPLARFAVIRPHQWGVRHFDPVQQTLTWAVLDRSDRPLILRIRFTSTESAALETLEQLDPVEAGILGIVGAISVEKGTLYCYPIALCRQTHAGQTSILNLQFSQQTAATANSTANSIAQSTANPATELAADFTDESEVSSDNRLVSTNLPLERFMADIQLIAERGDYALDRTSFKALTQQVSHFENIGMTTLASVIRNLTQASGDQSAQLLKARYLCHLYRQIQATIDPQH